MYKREYIKKETKNGKDVNLKKITLNQDQILEEDYNVKMGKELNKIFTTELGKIVSNFMQDNFKNIVNFEFTSEMENNLYEIAKGKEIS